MQIRSGKNVGFLPCGFPKLYSAGHPTGQSRCGSIKLVLRGESGQCRSGTLLVVDAPRPGDCDSVMLLDSYVMESETMPL